MSIETTGDSGPQPVEGSFEVTSSTVPLVTEAPVADEVVVTAAEDPPYQDVVSVRREGREAVLTVNGNETVLNAHDCQSLWRELSAIVPVI